MGDVPYRVPHAEPPGVPRQLLLILSALLRIVRMVTIIMIIIIIIMIIIMLLCANNRSVSPYLARLWPPDVFLGRSGLYR